MVEGPRPSITQRTADRWSDAARLPRRVLRQRHAVQPVRRWRRGDVRARRADRRRRSRPTDRSRRRSRTTRTPTRSVRCCCRSRPTCPRRDCRAADDGCRRRARPSLPATSATVAIVGDSQANALAINLPDGIETVFPDVVNGSVDGCSVYDSGSVDSSRQLLEQLRDVRRLAGRLGVGGGRPGRRARGRRGVGRVRRRGRRRHGVHVRHARGGRVLDDEPAVRASTRCSPRAPTSASWRSPACGR